MLWEVEIRPKAGLADNEGRRVVAESRELGATTIEEVKTARSFLIEANAPEEDIRRIAEALLVDAVVEDWKLRRLPSSAAESSNGHRLLNILFKPGVTDNVAKSAQSAMSDLGLETQAVSTCRKYWINSSADESDLRRVSTRLLANDAIEHVVEGPLPLESITLGSPCEFELTHVAIREMDDAALERLSREGQLFLSLTEMQTIRDYFRSLERDPTDVELETIAQTWSEHCSHKTLAGRIHYQDEARDIQFENMLKETVFAATVRIRETLGENDWCVSVFKDNAGIITFSDAEDVCIKVETHNHPSALEPYGGANTGLGGVIRDPLGTGLGARPVCNTDVFCFARPDYPDDKLPPGVLHPRTVLKGVVSGVRDYGNRMGIPTVNGAVCFDDRYLGNPLVYCGNVAMIPVGKSEGQVAPGHLIVAVGGRTGRDGIHGATFSSAELTEESETLSGGAVQIGNAITEKMIVDVILQARDENLYSAITDCGAGGFSSAVGEMGDETGAEVWLEKPPLKYKGLSYTEIWISEAQERMVLAVPEENWQRFENICTAEGVEATVIGRYTDTKRLVLKYDGTQVADLEMEFLHDGRPPVIREAVYSPPAPQPLELPSQSTFDDALKSILGSLNVASKEWIIRQYDHEVQAGSVVKPLVGVNNDGPSDAAVVRPDLSIQRGLVIACGMNPQFGDYDPYWMAASAIDEAVRNCVAVGADPDKIAILDNFCWGNTERPETLGSLVRAALACHDMAVAYGTPFVSGKDSLNNEFSYVDDNGEKVTVAIPSSLLITALGQIADVERAVTMDLKEAGNVLYLVGNAKNELGGSHYSLIHGLTGGDVPQVDADLAMRVFRSLHATISAGLVRSCHDLSEGGLAVAAAEMAFAGGLGAHLELRKLSESAGINDAGVLLFSESNSRFLVEVPAEKAAGFESAMKNVPCVSLGSVTDGDSLVVVDPQGETVIDSKLDDLKNAWKSPLRF